MDEELDVVTLIDHEYACFNFRGFELGNHFCEYVGFDIDMTKYPPRETQIPFLRTYLESYLNEKARLERIEEERKRLYEKEGLVAATTSPTGCEEKDAHTGAANTNGHDKMTVTEEMVERLYVEANKYSLASHLHWGIWGLAQARISTIEFDYFAYAMKRLKAYLQAKDGMLSLSA